MSTTTESRILTDNPNLCHNCGHSLQHHKITRWEKPDKKNKGKKNARIIKNRSIPWICTYEDSNGDDCRCNEYFLVRSPSYR